MKTTGGVVVGESHGHHISYGWEDKLCIRMLRIPERQESDKRKDTTSIHKFAAKLLKIIDFLIIFCNKCIIKVYPTPLLTISSLVVSLSA